MPTYEPIALNPESTVVAEYTPEPATATSYESEAQLEASFIAQLVRQGYESARITSASDMLANLRDCLERLNEVNLTEPEWQRLRDGYLANAGDGLAEKTNRIQVDYVHALKRDDGSTINIELLDKTHPHRNRLQVISQYEAPSAAHGGNAARDNRYDVTILINGLPLVHVELKRRGVDLREAFNQINRYARDSFWSDAGLFDYVQLFVISNGTLTKYYSNTTREAHLAEAGRPGRRRTTSNSFEFTSWWADAANQPITALPDFTRTFFAKHTLIALLTRYCVFDTTKRLIAMRPYQIVATERILTRISTSTNARQLGTRAAGGYIWHTTGSGKTLTSFKTAQLATALPGIDKVIFVVDRKDLDHQTIREYNRFAEGCANGNTSTRVLTRQLGDPAASIIVTTIQKLSRFIAANPGHPVLGAHVVLVFDECHRSQFGDMHKAITKAFKRYHLFGFTGTPIFAANASGALTTTEQTFGDRLHTYTIVDAIRDRNVLPFRIDYHNTVAVAPGVTDKQVPGIDTEAALLDPERLRKVVDYVLTHFAAKTKRAASYSHNGRRVSGFNSLFATASIEAAKRYYSMFQLAQRSRPDADQLTIAMVYSYAPNEAEPDGVLAEETFDTDGLDKASADALRDAIYDYNDTFSTRFDTDADGFQRYYEDVTRRLRNRELDLVIVVNMFLTGFDATTLNTLWVDKNLRQHGLVQAFSRTNRILNSVKTFGNIVSFRNLEEATNDALALFGNRDARGIVLLKPYAHYRDDYLARLTDLLDAFPPGQLIVGEEAANQFVTEFGALLRLRNILTSFDDFASEDPLTPRQLQDYTSVYLDLYASRRATANADKEQIADDLVFEIELVKQVEVNVDYILLLVRRMLESGGLHDREQRDSIGRAVDASPTLRNKKDLIEDFVDSLTVGPDSDVDAAWASYVSTRREAELAQIIAEERLQAEPTASFMRSAFRDGLLSTSGTAITAILPPVSRFAAHGGHADTKRRVIARLQAFFDRFHVLGASEPTD